MSDDSIIKRMETPPVRGVSEHYDNGEFTISSQSAYFRFYSPGTGSVQTRDGSVCTLDTKAYMKQHENGYLEPLGGVTLHTNRVNGRKGERSAVIALETRENADYLGITHHNYGAEQEIVNGRHVSQGTSEKTGGTVISTEGSRDSIGWAASMKESVSRAMGTPPKILDNSPEALQVIGQTMAAVGIRCSKDGQPSTPLLTPDEVGHMAKQALGAPKPEKGR